MGFLPNATPSPDSASDGSTPSENAGCINKMIALVLLFVSGSIIAGVGSFIPAGLDEVAATLLLAWSIKTLTGIDITSFLHRKGR